MMRIIATVLLFLLMVMPYYALASIPTMPELFYRQQQPITDDQLKQLAIEKSIISADTDKAYFQNELAKKNTVALWVLMSREDKIRTIEQVIQLFKENDSAIISRSASYYAAEINGVIYNSIVKGDVSPGNTRGVGVMLKTIAIMDGDYNDGNDKVELAQKQMGENFEVFKRQYPEKYRSLLKSQEKVGQ